jgi:iron complex outermembrane receptor protein
VWQDLEPTGGFGVFSLNAGFRIASGVILTAGIDNAFNEVYAEHVNAANPGLAGYVNTLRVNAPGRTAWIKLNWDV